MGNRHLLRTLLCVSITLFFNQEHPHHCHGKTLDKKALKKQVIEMFSHAYDSYMTYAYPADELMPLSCKGRVRGEETSRGDVDDALGRFSLTLIDTLDTLAVLGELDKFEEAVRLVVNDVSFDTDIVVSVFETNIRVLGGLLGGHVMALAVKEQTSHMSWYDSELLTMAKDIGYRLLPAFNTSTGMPYPRVNLRYGVQSAKSRTGTERDTCTACAGTMILEFAALSRLTGISIFEEKAHRAMQYIWGKRHRSNNLVGTTINIHNGDWVRRESGVGAGIDSYYEYCLKAYILLGEEIYLDRFNKHYDAVMRYVSNGPLLIDVHMHKPMTKSRNFMDALLAFWPGLQVLVGDIKPAMETHEMLYQVTKKHKFLPEAFTVDHNVYWGQHPLRPEFVESTFFLYKATGDPYYLEVGQSILDNLNQHARVPCGFAGMKDVRTGSHEDRMDSFVLAETFKYLYLLFAESDDVLIELDDYIFTTEAHLLPLYIGSMRNKSVVVNNTEAQPDIPEYAMNYDRTCPNHNYKQSIAQFAELIRKPSSQQQSSAADEVCSQSYRPTVNMPKRVQSKAGLLRAIDFIPGNKEHEMMLKKMGIRLVTMRDGRVQLLHTASQAATPEDAEDGMVFMQEMIELSKIQSQEEYQPRAVQLISPPYQGSIALTAGPAQFGMELHGQFGVYGEAVIADPFRACAELNNVEEFAGRIVVMERGDCMFIDKTRNIQKAGAIGAIIIDNNQGSSSDMSPIFAMSGDGSSDVTIAAIFLFWKEGKILLDAIDERDDYLEVMLVDKAQSIDDIMKHKEKGGAEKEPLENTASDAEQSETTPTLNSLKSKGPELPDDLVEAIMQEVQKMVGGEGGMADYLKQLEETQKDLKNSGYNMELELQYDGEEGEGRASDPKALEIGIDLTKQFGENSVWKDIQKLRKQIQDTVKVEQTDSAVNQGETLGQGSESQDQVEGREVHAPLVSEQLSEVESATESQQHLGDQQGVADTSSELGKMQPQRGGQHTVQPTPSPKMQLHVQRGPHPERLQQVDQSQEARGSEPKWREMVKPKLVYRSSDEDVKPPSAGTVHVHVQHESELRQKPRENEQQYAQETATKQHDHPRQQQDVQQHPTQQQLETLIQQQQREQQLLQQQHIQRHQQQQQQQQQATKTRVTEPDPPPGPPPEPQWRTHPQKLQDQRRQQQQLTAEEVQQRQQQQLVEEHLRLHQLRQEQLEKQRQENIAIQRGEQHLQEEQKQIKEMDGL